MRKILCLVSVTVNWKTHSSSKINLHQLKHVLVNFSLFFKVIFFYFSCFCVSI